MINILKMDFYRMFKSTSFWVFTTIIAVISGFTVYSFSKFFTDADEKFPVIDLWSMFIVMGITIIFTSIFVAKFVNNENKNGYSKNIAGLVTNKGYLAISKMIIATFFVIWCFVMWFAFIFLFSKIFFDYVSFANFEENLKNISGLLLANVALSQLIVFLAIWFRNAGSSMTVGILMFSGFSGLFGMLINLIFNNILGFKDFDVKVGFLSTYLQGTNITKLTIIVSSCYLIASAILGFIIMKKRDIK